MKGQNNILAGISSTDATLEAQGIVAGETVSMEAENYDGLATRLPVSTVTR